jgi:hypothetical protein
MIRGLGSSTLLGAALVLCGASVAAGATTTVLTEMTGEGGQVQYDFPRDPGNGWYVESGTPYRFKLGFKQGERASAHPVEVATVSVDPAERYDGTPSIVLQIIARHEDEPRSTAYYKVSVSSKQEKDMVKLPLLGGETLVHAFAMKIDPKSWIADGAPVVFEQFWQGSPFAAPVSLIMFSPDDARGMNWPDVGPRGNFAIKLNDDDHGPLHRFPTKAQYVDLGPIAVGVWMTWQVHVTPAPRQAAGEVQVFHNGKRVADVTHHKIGFDPSNPEYGTKRPSDQIDAVDILLYRDNGNSFQRIYFDNVSLSVVR